MRTIEQWGKEWFNVGCHVQSDYCLFCVCARVLTGGGYESAQSKNHCRSRSASVRGSDDTSCTSA